jgi:SAM-dependent methyltransferase
MGHMTRVGRSTVRTMTDDRTARVLAHIDPATMRGAEVGPSFSPFVRKREGAQVVVVDHADASALREKYRVHGVDLDAIEEVDVIWQGGSLAEALAGHAPFDYIIASHLLEHVTDPLGFLADCEQLLRPGGVLSLVLPDHRSCFDALRPPTTFGQWFDAHLGARTRHTPGTVLDHWLHAAQRDGIVWHPSTPTPLSMVHRRVDLDAAVAAASGDDYVDVHAWVFTPESFRALAAFAGCFGHTSLEIVEASDPIGYEFFVTLRRPDAAPSDAARAAAFDDRLGVLVASLVAEAATPVAAARAAPASSAAPTTGPRPGGAALAGRIARRALARARALRPPRGPR